MSRESFTDYKATLTELEQVKIDYGIEVAKNELSKAAFFMVFFSMIGYWRCCALCVLIGVSLRVFAGGLHMKTYLTCFLYSFAILFFVFI